MEKFTKNFILPRAAALLFMMTTIFIMAPLPVYASVLPAELGEWRLVSEHVTHLATAEDQGMWVNGSYARLAPIAYIEVQLTEGPGFGPLFVPDGRVSANDGPIGFFSSTYETLSIAGRRAVLENRDIIGKALAVALEARTTVTFESRGVSREALLSFAESMIEALQ